MSKFTNVGEPDHDEETKTTQFKSTIKDDFNKLINSLNIKYPCTEKFMKCISVPVSIEIKEDILIIKKVKKVVNTALFNKLRSYSLETYKYHKNDVIEYTEESLMKGTFYFETSTYKTIIDDKVEQAINCKIKVIEYLKSIQSDAYVVTKKTMHNMGFQRMNLLMNNFTDEVNNFYLSLKLPLWYDEQVNQKMIYQNLLY